MSLGKKLTLGFSVLILLVVAMCGWSYWTSHQVLKANTSALAAQTKAQKAQAFSEQSRRWKERIALARSGHQHELQLLQASLLRNQQPANAFLKGRNDHLGLLLNSAELRQLATQIAGSQDLLDQLQQQHTLLLQQGQALQEVWQVRHEGLAPKLEELKRTLLNGSLKTANMIFVQSSISELVADELEETALEEFLASPIYKSFAPTYPALVKTFERARVTNEALYRAIYDLDDIMMEAAWERARLHYRDKFPPLTKSLVVDIDGLLSQENRILRSQAKGIQILNGPLSQASESTQDLLTQLQEVISSQAVVRQQEASAASQAVLRAGEAVGERVHLMQGTNLTLTIVIVVLSVLLSLFLIRGTTRPLAQTVAMLHDLEAGKLERRLEIRSRDEFGAMARAMNSFADTLQHQVLTAFRCLAQGDFTFQAQGLIAEPLAEANQSLNRLMEQIDCTAQQVNLGSNQISTTSHTLSYGATEQARSTEDISHQLEAISQRTHTNSQRVIEANALANQAQDATEHGRQQMEQMTGAMDEINQAGDDISNIIKTIDEIAFQTNLLALNAAVEAARAGKHGKGFAVVAEEVRNLAARSASAASETASLIEDAVARAQRGSDIAERTSNALDGIEGTIAQLGGLIHEVSDTFVEQASGIQQTHDRLQDIGRVTEQNTAHAEEAAAAAAELAGQAASLHQLIGQFKLHRQGTDSSFATPTLAADPQLSLPDTEQVAI